MARFITRLSITATISGFILIPYFGYRWWSEDPTNPEPKYAFWISICVAVVGALELLREHFNDTNIQRRESDRKSQRITFSHIADGVEHELQNFEKLESGNQYVGYELKAVADYSFKCLREEIDQLPKWPRFLWLVPAIRKEIECQLAVADWNARDAKKIIPLVRKLLRRINPFVATEEELLAG